MKKISVAGAVLFLSAQLLCQAHAIELCQPQDYYLLMNSSKCKIPYNKAGEKGGSNDAMFEIMNNYPFENKDAFTELFQSKIKLIDNYITQQQGQKQTGKVRANISKLERARQGLSEQLGVINSATRDNWVSVRGRARKELKESARSLREVE